MHVQINSVIRIHHIYKCIHNNFCLRHRVQCTYMYHIIIIHTIFRGCMCGGDLSCMEDTPPLLTFSLTLICSKGKIKKLFILLSLYVYGCIYIYIHKLLFHFYQHYVIAIGSNYILILKGSVNVCRVYGLLNRVKDVPCTWNNCLFFCVL